MLRLQSFPRYVPGSSPGRPDSRKLFGRPLSFCTGGVLKCGSEVPKYGDDRARLNLVMEMADGWDVLMAHEEEHMRMRSNGAVRQVNDRVEDKSQRRFKRPVDAI